MLRSLASGLTDLVYPRLCLGCEERLPPEAALPVCTACLRRLPVPPPGAALAQIRQRSEGVNVEAASALWAYDESATAQRIQHALKYGGQPSLGVPLGHLMAEAWRGQAFGAVVPVPLSRVRVLERGYNQAAVLAEGVAETLGVPLLDAALVRTRPTRTQTRLSASERWRNVSGAFRLRHDGLRGVRVLLVDDVLTTGATLTAAAQCLGEAGATVSVATLMQADAP